MSDEEDYNSEEDEDYVPTDGEQVSEEENSGDEEDLTALQDESDPQHKVNKKRPTARKKAAIATARKRKGGIKLEESTTEAANDKDEEEAKRKKELEEQIQKEEEEKKAEKEKKRKDDLWSSFMSDVKKAPVKPSGSGLGSLSTQVKSTSSNGEKVSPGNTKPETKEKSGKVTITKVFDFAGEEVKITKEVDADSKEAKEEQKKEEQKKEETSSPAATSSLSTSSPFSSSSVGGGSVLSVGAKRPAVGGLSSVLNRINKKTKMGTLEKSKLDWDSFKRKEGIEDDLKIHNKGKQGYMERMAFLNRADQRQYELERDLRLGSSSKR